MHGKNYPRDNPEMGAAQRMHLQAQSIAPEVVGGCEAKIAFMCIAAAPYFDISLVSIKHKLHAMCIGFATHAC